MPTLAAIRRNKSVPVVAIIENDDTERYLLAEQLRSWGYQPESFDDGNYQDVGSLIHEIKGRGTDFVLCDNHLQQSGYAGFYGMEVVAALNGMGIPGVLITQHQDTDDLRLKEWRPKLPVVLDKDEIDRDNVETAFHRCAAEVKDASPAGDRRPYRVLVDVEGIVNEEVIAFVDAWNPHVSVSFPRQLINHLGEIGEETFLFAKVNIGAVHRRDLFFSDFELAPKLTPDDDFS